MKKIYVCTCERVLSDYGKHIYINTKSQIGIDFEFITKLLYDMLRDDIG